MDRIIGQSGVPVQLNPASLVFFAAASLSAWLVVLAWGRRNEPSGPPLISLLVFEGLWALCEAIEAVLLDPSAQAVDLPPEALSRGPGASLTTVLRP